MSRYIMRLDDACEKRDIEKWDRMEVLLDKYSVKPLVGIIPHCEDPMMDKYTVDDKFWTRVDEWIFKGWTIALHGYNHVYSTSNGGLNPVNKRSEFAGESLEVQKEKIRRGVAVLKAHGIEPQIFFAPSHTFDEITIQALKECSEIRIISDTIANKPYLKYGMTFVPQQSGKVRKLPFDTLTFCYHPNVMEDEDFKVLENFLRANEKHFGSFPIESTKRRLSIIDVIIEKIYFARRK